MLPYDFPLSRPNRASSVMDYSTFFSVHFFFFFILSSFAPLSLSFLSSENFTLSGDAHIRNNAILLTKEHSCLPFSSNSHSGVGTAFYVNPFRFLDFSTNSTASFSSRFSFSIVPTPFCPFADGIAFLITSDTKSFSRSLGHMGLPDPSLDSHLSFVAVEFDTNFHPDLGDINDNHLGLDLNSPTSLTSVDFWSSGIALKNGRKITAWIEYRDDIKMIQVWVGYSQTRPANPLLVAQIDLSKQFKEFMYVGFSASNGKGSALYIVDRWLFRTFGLVPSLSPVGAINEGDCFMCSLEDSSTNSSHVVDARMGKKIGETTLGLGGLAAFVCCIVAIVGYVLIKKFRGRMSRGRVAHLTSQVHMNRVPMRFSLQEIKLATMGFNQNRVVGEGGSATVYKGSLSSSGEVAVKRFERSTPNNCQCIPFTTEFATMAGSLRHENLVQLHGWCCEANELMLVYEYLPNGSLAELLHNNSNSQFVLPWKKRLSIVLGVASALTYLHEECENQIIHRDVKTCNIMLDAEFNAKLVDFGLAEVYEHSSKTREATIPAGTMGYLAPEYVYSGVPTVKSDVYSFGVVMLEVVSGRRAVEEDGTVLVSWIWDQWEVGKLIEASDSRLMGEYNVVEMERILMVGLLCVHPNHEKRPTAKEAARILKGEAPLPLLPSRKPRVNIKPFFS
ncbi:L-type lectin-domain containing receptor kinase S.6 [Cucurbita maxima]|uniref:non-specific serine/threonine protein kinase n=1 Tax=Cucurbita maxima TaxID=3661 RepID=A0A6J1JQ90_CUCMA|nr:L-type lectin-domain containing receptor kinase S.6 [Cucurbita maxima]